VVQEQKKGFYRKGRRKQFKLRMIRRIKTIRDVVDWRLCTGCGACYYACNKGAISLINIESVGIRPKFNRKVCSSCTDCLSICPGNYVNANLGVNGVAEKIESDLLIGPTLEIWEGFAADKELRFFAASGGVLSALALYCLEKEHTEFVLHTGANPSQPWTNRTVISRNKDDLAARTGSRYAPASPCDGLQLIEEAKAPCVFIGKPCDVAAVSLLRKQRPLLNTNLGLVLTFFCAGTPSTKGTLELLKKLDITPKEIEELRYRGNGWPGSLRVVYNNRLKEKSVTYGESWSFLEKFRPFRCHLCPDGLGQMADISCGDAWHRYTGNGDAGRSLILVRSQRGHEILHRAMAAGYLELTPSDTSEVVAAQEGLLEKRKETFGRLTAMHILLTPTPRFVGFSLFEAWTELPLLTKLRSILSTFKRLVHRGLWRRGDYDSV